MLKKFKEFIAKGNVMDMAVGVIVGAAFKDIVNSLVADIFTPFISLFTGGVDFSESFKWILKPEVVDKVTAEVITPALSVNVGAFIQKIIDFLLIAICIFIVVQVAQTLRTKMEALAKKKEEEEKAAEPPKPSNEEVLLTEIRDLLKEKNN